MEMVRDLDYWGRCLPLQFVGLFCPLQIHTPARLSAEYSSVKVFSIDQMKHKHVDTITQLP